MRFQVGEDRVRIWTVHIDLFTEQEGDAEVQLANLRHCLVRLWLLPGELVAWETDDHEPFVLVLLVDRLEVDKLRCESALRRSVDEQ